MQLTRSIAASVLVGVLTAACGGGSPTQPPAGATQNPAATQGGAGGATQAPAATQSGGGGNIDSTYGKIHIEISGPVTKSADYGFIPAGSIFGGAQGSAFNFTNSQEASEIVSIYVSPDGKVVVSWVGSEFSAPGTECTTSNWNIGATSAAGSFDCTGAAIMASGAMVQGAKLKGSFDAHT